MEVQHIQLHKFLILALDRDKWFASWSNCFTLNRRMGWPQRLSGWSEDERKILPTRKWWMIPWSSSPQHCLFAQQAVAQQIQKFPTWHTEWTFILSLQAPSARSIPSATSHLTVHKTMLVSSIYVQASQLISSIELWTRICILLFLPFSFSDLQSLYFLKPPVHATCTANHIIHNFVTITTFAECYILLCSVVCYQM